MKVTSADIFMINPKPVPEFNLTPVIIRVNTDEGIYGYGEAGLPYANVAPTAFSALKELAKQIIGLDPIDTGAIWAKLSARAALSLGGAFTIAAISAIDIALWDIKGKALGLPLYKLMGGKQRDKLRTYASQLQRGWPVNSNPLRNPQDYFDAAKVTVQEGYTAVKVNFLMFDINGRRQKGDDINKHLLKPVLGLAEERLSAVREAIGPDMDIILENHCMTGVNTAIQFGRVARKYGIMFYEEPVSPLNPEDMKKVADNLDIPLASGERIYTRWGFLPFMKNSSLGTIQPDVCNSGGITETIKIVDLSQVYDVTFQAHVCGSPIAQAAAMHVETAAQNFIIHEHNLDSIVKENKRLGLYDYQPMNGYLTVPELPGLGQELSEYAIKTAVKESVC